MLSLLAKCKQNCKNQSCTPLSHCWLNNPCWPQFLKRSFYTLCSDIHNATSQRLPAQTLIYHSIIIIFIYLQNSELDTTKNRHGPAPTSSFTFRPSNSIGTKQLKPLYLPCIVSTSEGDKFMQKHLCQRETVLPYSCLLLSFLLAQAG